LGDTLCFSSVKHPTLVCNNSYSRPKFARVSPTPCKLPLTTTTDLIIKGTNIVVTRKLAMTTMQFKQTSALKKKKKVKKKKQMKKEEEEYNKDLEYKIIQPLEPPKYNFINQMRPRGMNKKEELPDIKIQDISNINSPEEINNSDNSPEEINNSDKKESLHFNSKPELNKSKEDNIFSRIAKRMNNEMRFVNTMLDRKKAPRSKTFYKKHTKPKNTIKRNEENKQEEIYNEAEDEQSNNEIIPIESFKSETACELYNLTKDLFAEVA